MTSDNRISINILERDPLILTVIITLRVDSRYDMIGRLENRLLDTRIPSGISFLIVDEGSQPDDANRLQQQCARLSFKYLRVDSGKSVFCAATARNAGAAIAQSKFIMHEDVDLFPYPGFYQSILDEIDIQELALHEHRFITVPTIYLSEDATLDALNGKRSKNAIIHDFLLRQDTVNSYLPASSVIVVSKNHYLSIGGYDDRFLGWGLEDLEYAYRLTRSASLFLSPADHRHLIEYGYGSSTEYRGWRAQFRLHGELLSRKGIYIFHAYHPRNSSWSNKEMHAQNRKLFNERIEEFDANCNDMNDGYNKPRQAIDIRSPVYDIFRNWIKTNLPEEYAVNLLLKPSEVLAEGRLAYRRGRYLQAALFFDQASSHFPDKAVHYREAAEAYAMAGLREEALSRLRKALPLAENNQSIRRRLRELARPSWIRRLGILPETPYPVG